MYEKAKKNTVPSCVRCFSSKEKNQNNYFKLLFCMYVLPYELTSVGPNSVFHYVNSTIGLINAAQQLGHSIKLGTLFLILTDTGIRGLVILEIRGCVFLFVNK